MKELFLKFVPPSNYHKFGIWELKYQNDVIQKNMLFHFSGGNHAISGDRLEEIQFIASLHGVEVVTIAPDQTQPIPKS
jgi:hypothetical protein